MKVFTEWTVLSHRPIETLTENLWRVSGIIGSIQRQMTVGRLRDGRLMIVNAIALDEPSMTALEAWGEPAILVVPNAYHRQDARIWKQRYPKLTVVAPGRARKRVERVVPVDTTSDRAPGDDRVRVVPMDGYDTDTLVQIDSDDGTTLVFCDAVLNLKPKRGATGFMLAPTGRPSTPRIQRWFMLRDRRAFAAHLDRLAALPNLRRVLVGHGAPITEDPAAALRAVAAELR